MNTLVDTPTAVKVSDGTITIVMSSRNDIRFSAVQSPRLASASDEQLRHVTLSPFGVHWPLLDEDLSIRGLRQGTTVRDLRVLDLLGRVE
jgi:hypothetical protein